MKSNWSALLPCEEKKQCASYKFGCWRKDLSNLGVGGPWLDGHARGGGPTVVPVTLRVSRSLYDFAESFYRRRANLSNVLEGFEVALSKAPENS